MRIQDVPIGTKFRVSIGFMPSNAVLERTQEIYENGKLIYNARYLGGYRTLVQEEENCVPCSPLSFPDV